MSHTLFTGRLVRLSAPDPEQHAGEIARWGRDPEFLTLLSTGIARPWSAAAVKKELQENLGDDEPRVGVFPFVIHTLAAAGQPERLVGFINLSLGGWPHRDAWIGVGIGQ